MKKVLYLLLLIFISACTSSSNHSKSGEGFPLREIRHLSADFPIRFVAVSDTWVVLASPDTLLAKDAKTGDILWQMDGFLIDTDSIYQIEGDYFIAEVSEKIIIINKSGEMKFLQMREWTNNIIRVVAVSKNHLYVIRGNWVLEAYDFVENQYLWEISVSRGITRVYPGSDENTPIVVSPDRIYTIENSTGELLWQQIIKSDNSAFNNPVLFFVSVDDRNAGTHQVTAFNTASGEQKWSITLELDTPGRIHQIIPTKNLLVLVTNFNHIALDIKTGEEIWRLLIPDGYFYSQPVLIDDVLYSKTAAGQIYAISMATGDVIGYLSLPSSPALLHEEDIYNNLFKIENYLVTINDKALIFLGQR